MLKDQPFCELEITLQGSIMYSEYSLSERINQWNGIIAKEGINTGKINWNAKQITQISSKIIYSSFAKLLVDKIADASPSELNDLSGFLFERLQQANSDIL